MKVATTLFEVSPHVKPATHPLREIPATKALNDLLGLASEAGDSDTEFFYASDKRRRLEASSVQEQTLVRDVAFHPLVAAVHLAFDTHRPLCLSPDMIWLLIAQGVANHVNVNAEQLRPLFVKHQGKIALKVRRDSFEKGSDKNSWPDVFGEFSIKIREHIGESCHDLLVPRFSTTGTVEKAAVEIVLLDAMQFYFDYIVETMCGIPKIKLEGTLADWQDLLERAKSLAQFQLDWWVDVLVPILEQFVQAVAGNPNRHFWQSIYKFEEMSGGDHITGWISAFFPYLKPSDEEPPNQRNDSLPAVQKMLANLFSLDADAEFDFNLEDDIDFDNAERYAAGFHNSGLPLGLSIAPFRWSCLDRSTLNLIDYEMEFVSGFIGVKQDRELFLRPEIGWAVCEVESHPKVINSWMKSFRQWLAS